MPSISTRTFMLYLALSAGVSADSNSSGEVGSVHLQCFIENFERYETIARATSFVVVDFNDCPKLPSSDEIVEAVVAAMGGNIINSLGQLEFADDSGLSSSYSVFTNTEALCLRDWIENITIAENLFYRLEDSTCFVIN